MKNSFIIKVSKLIIVALSKIIVIDIEEKI